MIRLILFLVPLASFSATAAELALHQCDDKLANCNDDCSLSHGSSTKDAARAKLAKCLSHCENRDKSCRERYFDAQQAKIVPTPSSKDAEEQRTRFTDEDPKGKTKAAAKTHPPVKAAVAPPAPAPEKKKQRPLDEWDPE